jgi:hypothetical protein
VSWEARARDVIDNSRPKASSTKVRAGWRPTPPSSPPKLHAPKPNPNRSGVEFWYFFVRSRRASRTKSPMAPQLGFRFFPARGGAAWALSIPVTPLENLRRRCDQSEWRVCDARDENTAPIFPIHKKSRGAEQCLEKSLFFVTAQHNAPRLVMGSRLLTALAVFALAVAAVKCQGDDVSAQLAKTRNEVSQTDGARRTRKQKKR